MPYGLDHKTIRSIKKVFQENPDLSLVYIYGSRANNTYNKLSDIDLAVVLKKPKKGVIGKLKLEFEELPIIQEIDLVDEANIHSSEFKKEYKKNRKLFLKK